MRLLTLDMALSDAVTFGCCYRVFFGRRLFRTLFLLDADTLLLAPVLLRTRMLSSDADVSLDADSHGGVLTNFTRVP